MVDTGGPREHGGARDGGRRARVDGRAEALLPRAQGAAHPLGMRGPAHCRLQPAQQEGKNQRYRKRSCLVCTVTYGKVQ
jgi:hypothetical protein